MAKKADSPLTDAQPADVVQPGAPPPADATPPEAGTEQAQVLETPPAESEVIEAYVEPTRTVRRLKVNRTFIGARSNENAILPGLYYEDDPFIFGLADFLVANAYAEWYG